MAVGREDVPPNLTVPRGKSPLVAREGDTVELECLVSGKPKPIILWSRADKEAPMPDGSMQTESYDGVLRVVNVSREMTGSYRCQTSQFNGFNVKAREALVELIVQLHRLRVALRGGPGVTGGLERSSVVALPFCGRPISPFETGLQRWWEQEIPVEGAITKGELITHNLTELIKPESYEVRLTPITHYAEGDSTTRIITYSAPINPHLREFHCSFEEEPICMFTQDKNDDFDWTRHSAATRDTKYTPNTGPSGDRSGSKQGFYMYIETSRPRKEGDQARLISPFFNVAPKTPYGITNPPAYCLGFFYHMYGKHIGTLNAFLKQKGQTTTEGAAWSLTGNQGDRWKQAKVSIHPSSSFQVVIEGVRGPGIEGDIAIDDVTLEEGECRDPPPNLRSSAPPAVIAHIWLLFAALATTLLGGQSPQLSAHHNHHHPCH
ncbi:unnamed protein product [Boreogadus saida]